MKLGPSKPLTSTEVLSLSLQLCPVAPCSPSSISPCPEGQGPYFFFILLDIQDEKMYSIMYSLALKRQFCHTFHMKLYILYYRHCEFSIKWSSSMGRGLISHSYGPKTGCYTGYMHTELHGII